MGQRYSTKHAGIDLPARFRFRPLERTSTGKIWLLDKQHVEMG
jgi:hypothetical protein